MVIKYNVTGAARKALVNAVGEIVGTKPEYLGMPSAAYRIDCFTVTKEGALEFDDRADSGKTEHLLESLEKRGFKAAENVGGKLPAEAESPSQGETAALTVAIPLDMVNTENLNNLIASKAGLIKKALGITELPVNINEDSVSFPWFDKVDGDSAKAYTHFISALCKLAKDSKRISAVEKPAENEKYAFRCFLLRLGFIGTEYKTERQVLLKNLAGSSAFKNGGKHGISS